MKPDLHKFTGYVQPLTAETKPELPDNLNYLKIYFIGINLYKTLSTLS